MLKKIIERVHIHPWIAFIVIIQLVFILVLSFKACIRPRHIVSLKMNEFNVEGGVPILKMALLNLLMMGA